jgi:hypothetical protein
LDENDLECITAFGSKQAAINYIGIVPKKRGNGYVNYLIVAGIRILNENTIKKVIADIDVKNLLIMKILN